MSKKNPNVIPVTIHADAKPRRNYYASWKFAIPSAFFALITMGLVLAAPLLEFWKLAILTLVTLAGWYTVCATPNHYRKVWIRLGLGRYVAHLESDGQYVKNRHPMVSEIVRPDHNKDA